MKDMPAPYDQIEDYLLGRLPRAEEPDMERAIREDPALAEEVELRRLEFDTARVLIAEDIRAIFQRLEEEENNEKPAPAGKSGWPGNRPLWYYLAAAAVLAPLAYLAYRALFPSMPEPLKLSLSTSAVSRNGGSDGSINLSIDGGTPEYAIVWSNGQTSKDLSELPSGAYTVTVTDAGGNTSIASAMVTQPPAIAEMPPQPTPDTSRKVNTLKKSPPVRRQELPTENRQLIALAENIYERSKWNSPGAFSRAADPAKPNPAALAAKALERRDYAAALDHLKNAGPDDTRGPLLQAHAYFNLGRFGDAAAAVRGLANAKKPPYGEEAETLLLLSLLANGKSNTTEFQTLLGNIRNDKGHEYYDAVAALPDTLIGKQ